MKSIKQDEADWSADIYVQKENLEETKDSLDYII